MGILGKEKTLKLYCNDCIMTIQSKQHKYCQSRHTWLMLNLTWMRTSNYKGYAHLLGSLVKKGCPSASLAFRRSAGSYRRSPCKRSIKSPAEWSTCCIIRFCNREFNVHLITHGRLCIIRKGSKKSSMYKFFQVITWQQNKLVIFP